MQRFKTRQQFQAVLAAELVTTSSHFALHRLVCSKSNCNPAQSLFPKRGLWVGAMTPKRWAKRAVTRNAIRRQIYVVCATLDSQLDAAVVVRLRREFCRKDFISASSNTLKNEAKAELHALLSRYFQPASVT